MHLLKGLQPQSIDDMLKTVPEGKMKYLFYKNFALWCQYSKFIIDGKEEFSFNNRRFLLPIYLDDSKEIVWLKAAQTGATIFMLLKLLWFARYHKLKCGLYFPNDEGVKRMSKDRFGPLIDSSPELRRAVSENSDSLALKQINNVYGGMSSLYLMSLGGVSSRDSVPLDVVAFDEVRLVKSEDIDQALERLSASKYKYKMFMSTSGSSMTSIHKRFLGGTQAYWTSACGCLDGIVLAEKFPDCIITHKGETYYRCPRCKYRINDPQNGRYVERNPGAPYPSYHVSQLVVNNLTPAEIWRSYNETTNRPEFWNAKLGLPFSDPENVPIDDDVLKKCVNENLVWASRSPSLSPSKQGNVMGVDQMHGYSYVVIGRRSSEGKINIVHYEIIERGNPLYGDITPFKRIHALMKEYGVVMAVVDAQPSFDEAADLAKAFPGKVFLAYYTYGGQDMVRWGDRPREKATIRKGGKDIKLPWITIINRYQAIDWVTRELQQAEIQFPNPNALVSLVRNEKTGRFENENIFVTRFFKHLKSVERVRDYDPDKGTEKLVWKENIDPHSLHALVYMMVAMGRARKTSAMLSW